MPMLEEHAVKAGQFSYTNQTDRVYAENVGYFEPDVLPELEKNGRLYVIAEGVLGTVAGAVASQYAVKNVLHDFYRTATEPDLEKRLLSVIEKTNREIFERNQQHPARRKMAAAFMAALIHHNKLTVANVGDNRAYVVWENSLERLGQEPDTEPATSEVEWANPTGLGMAAEVKPQLFFRRLFPGDTVVLCSGGLTGYVDEQEITTTIADNPPLVASRKLTQLARERGCQDYLAVSVTQMLEQSVAQVPPTRGQLPESPKWAPLLTPLPKKPSLSTTIQTVANSSAAAEPAEQQKWFMPLGVMSLVVLLCMAGAFALAWQSFFPGVAPTTIAEATDTLTPTDTTPEIPTEAANNNEANPSGTTTPETALAADLVSPVATSSGALMIDELATAVQTEVTPLPTPTTTPTPRPTVIMPPGCTNGARFLRDATIPDGSEITAGSQFDKSWVLMNNGTCPWAPGYTIRFVEGDMMHEQGEMIVPIVLPEVVTDVTMPLLAPPEPGNYRSTWQMHDLAEEPFGAKLYVEIEVVPPEPGTIIIDPDETTLYNFIDNADQANWFSDDVATYQLQENRIDAALTITAPLGVVVTGIAEMRGRQDTTQPVLLSHPHQETGSIEGQYDIDVPLQPSDELIAMLGFPQVALSNSDGATFEVLFLPDEGTQKVLLSELVTYRESPINRRVSLTGITPGATGQFILRVLSGQEAAYYWALWLDLRLVRE